MEKYEKPFAEIVIFNFEDVKMLDWYSKNDGEGVMDGNGDKNGSQGQ